MATLTSQQSTPAVQTTAKPLALSLRILLVFTAIYLCTWAGHYTSGDGAHKIAWAKVMLFGRNSGMTPDQNGVYSKYGIGHSLLAIPPLAIAYAIQKTTGIRTEAAWYTLMFIVNGAVFLALVAYYLAHYYPPRAVWATVSILGLATIWWPYTKLDFSEPLVLTTAFLGFVLIRFGYPIPGMLIAGFMLAIRSDSVAILGPLVLWYLLTNRSVRAAIITALSLAPSVALCLFANYIRYHSFLDLGYAQERFSNPFLVGVYGILLSSGKSVFLFSPPLLLGVWGWRRFVRRSDLAPDAWLFLGIGIAQLLLYSRWWDWASDEAWGDRFVIPAVLLLCIPLIAVVHRRAIVIPVAIAGMFVQLLAVSVGGLDFFKLVWSQPSRAGVLTGGTNRLDFADVWFNPNYSQIFGNWILLRYLLHAPPAAGRMDDSETVGTRLYDAIPPQQWQAAAHWDFVWNLRHPSDTQHSRETPDPLRDSGQLGAVA